jgi:hypothetical protein
MPRLTLGVRTMASRRRPLLREERARAAANLLNSCPPSGALLGSYRPRRRSAGVNSFPSLITCVMLLILPMFSNGF